MNKMGHQIATKAFKIEVMMGQKEEVDRFQTRTKSYRFIPFAACRSSGCDDDGCFFIHGTMKYSCC
jgi:hypothetical protein